MNKVKLLGPFEKLQPNKDDGGFWLVEGEGQAVADILNKVSIAKEMYGYIILVNGVRVKENYILSKGDKVLIKPSITGG